MIKGYQIVYLKTERKLFYVSIISCNGNLMKFDFFSPQLWDCSMSFSIVKTSFRKERQKSAFFLEPSGLGPVLRQGNSATLLCLWPTAFHYAPSAGKQQCWTYLELSRTMAYATPKTVNRLVRKQLHLNRVVSERQKRNKPIHQARNIKMSLDKRIAISEYSYGISEEKCIRTNMTFMIRIYYCTCKQF